MNTLRSDYLLYALAAVFFVITAVSLVMVVEQTQKSLWVVTTVVLGLFSLGLGYYQRPKVKTVSSESSVSVPPATMPQPQQPAIGDAHEVEASRAENVGRAVEAPILPASPTPVPMQVSPPMPVLAPAPVVETQAVPKDELTRVKGIGAKRAAQLKAQGINNIDDLAKASVGDVVAKLGVTRKVAKKWIANAKELAE
jgi:predicted flap endonuclease-1-like 5' DNA nuclease